MAVSNASLGTATLAAAAATAVLAVVALLATTAWAVPESSDEQIASHCTCAFLDSCDAQLCATAATADACSALKTQCTWRDTTTQNRLASHTHEFGAPEVVTVAPGVHVAIGFGLANCVLIEGPDGAIVVDTLESVKAALPVRAAFDALLAPSGKRIVALIYTHGHTDHTYGAAAFADVDADGNLAAPVAIYAHASLPANVRDSSLVTGALYQRSQRQFGTYLATGPDGHINSGIGPGLAHDNSSLIGYLRPTILYEDRLDVVIAGLNVTLLHTPGETGDHTFVYLADQRVGLIGDNVYRAFPNLYSIRGTRARSVRTWFQSLDTVLDLPLDVLVPAHTQPLYGDAIRERLLAYRDGMQYVHDQTLRLLNLGFSTEEIVDKVRLPEYLATHPYLQEYYGTVHWGVRAVVDYYIGWFEGRASKLNPLPWREQAQRLVDLAGGPEAAVAKAMAAFHENTVASLQWALQLSEAVLVDRPDDIDARRLASTCLRFLGFQQLTANGRNYYLSESARLAGHREYDISDELQAASFIALPIDSFLYTLPLMLNTRKSDTVADFAVALVLPDDAVYTVRVRRHVAELREYPRSARARDDAYAPVHLTVSATEEVLKTVILTPAAVPDLLAEGRLRLEPDEDNGGLALLQEFAGLFEMPSVGGLHVAQR